MNFMSVYANIYNWTSVISKFFYSFTPPAVKPLTKYFSKYINIKSTGKVTITDPAIKYWRGVSASPLRNWIALDKVNDLGLSKNINEKRNSFHFYKKIKLNCIDIP